MDLTTTHKTNAGGSIDYNHYINRGRRIRSLEAHGLIFKAGQGLKRVGTSIANFVCTALLHKAPEKLSLPTLQSQWMKSNQQFSR